MKILSSVLACAAVATAQYVPVTGYTRVVPAHAGVRLASTGATPVAAAQPARAGIRVAAGATPVAAAQPARAGVRVAAGAQPAHGGTAASLPRSHGKAAPGQAQGEGNTGNLDMDVEPPHNPFELYDEARFGLSQAQYSKDYSRNYVSGGMWDAFNSLPEVDLSLPGMDGMGSSLMNYHFAGKYEDAYSYNLDKLHDAIDHHIRNNPYQAHDPALRNLELALEAEEHRVNAYKMWKWDAILPEGTGLLGRWNFVQRRNADAERSYWNLQEAYDDYYYTEEGTWDTVNDAMRSYWADENERKGEIMRLAGLPGELFAPSYIKVTANTKKHARKARREAEDNFYENPSWDSERELYLAELAEDSARYDHLARIGQFFGNSLLTNWAWYKDGQAQDDYNDMVLDHLEDEYYDSLYAGDFGFYGGAYGYSAPYGYGLRH